MGRWQTRIQFGTYRGPSGPRYVPNWIRDLPSPIDCMYTKSLSAIYDLDFCSALLAHFKNAPSTRGLHCSAPLKPKDHCSALLKPKEHCSAPLKPKDHCKIKGPLCRSSETQGSQEHLLGSRQ